MNLIFIIGTGRCGSSLVHETLAKHEDIGFISNIEDNLPWLNLKGRWNNMLFRSPLGRFTRKGRLRFAPSEAYRLISHQVSPIYENSCRDLEARDVTPWLKSRFQDFFSQRYERQGKPLFLHKYTGWSRIGFMCDIFPNARFIHIIRDGRAVANSCLQMPWWSGYRGPENWLWGSLSEPYLTEWLESNCSYTLLAGIAWKVLLDSYERASKNLDKDKYLCLTYENFIANPREVMDSVLSFMGLPWTSKFEAYLNKQNIYMSRSCAYERDLSPEQLLELQSSLASKLAFYGYLD